MGMSLHGRPAQRVLSILATARTPKIAGKLIVAQRNQSSLTVLSFVQSIPHFQGLARPGLGTIHSCVTSRAQL